MTDWIIRISPISYRHIKRSHSKFRASVRQESSYILQQLRTMPPKRKLDDDNATSPVPTKCRQQNYRVEYSLKYPILAKSKISEMHVYCKACKTDFTVKHGGLHDSIWLILCKINGKHLFCFIGIELFIYAFIEEKELSWKSGQLWVTNPFCSWNCSWNFIEILLKIWKLAS